MSSVSDWRVPSALQPNASDYAFDLDRALAAVVGLRSLVPPDAFTAESLGTERAGNGVIIRSDGLVLTIGYLIAESETVWLTLADGRVLQGYPVAYDQDTGFGLVQPLARLNLPALSLGSSQTAKVGDHVVIAGAGGRQRSVAARIVEKQEFAGYWEYVLDEAIFVGPAHPNWGGTALIGPDGTLLGIGSLQLQRGGDDKSESLNMIVPVDLLTPILDDLTRYGRANRPARPWLGLYATEVEDKIVLVGVAKSGPAHESGLREGDIVLAVDGSDVSTLASFFRSIWSQGQAGTDVPLRIFRDGRAIDLRVTSADRRQFLKSPSLH